MTIIDASVSVVPPSGAVLAEYTNNNYTVKLFQDGTKIREWDEAPNPVFPESLDFKITNYCDAGCPYCHEQSTKRGKHGDTQWILDFIDQCPQGMEIAIGGGNPLSHPDLEIILKRMKDRGIVPNMTVNARHVTAARDQLNFFRNQQMLFGLGISYDHRWHQDVADAHEWFGSNVIVHTIAGVQKISDVMKFPREWKLLVLGFKQYGFGQKYFQTFPAVPAGIKDWRFFLPTLVSRFHCSFDNLALKQLAVQQWLKPEAWDRLYMGDDGQFTMYVDGTEQTYAVSSTKDRVPVGDLTLKEMFTNVQM